MPQVQDFLEKNWNDALEDDATIQLALKVRGQCASEDAFLKVSIAVHTTLQLVFKVRF